MATLESPSLPDRLQKTVNMRMEMALSFKTFDIVQYRLIWAKHPEICLLESDQFTVIVFRQY